MIILKFESEIELRTFIRDNTPTVVKGVQCNTPTARVFQSQHVFEKTVRGLTEAFINQSEK